MGVAAVAVTITDSAENRISGTGGAAVGQLCAGVAMATGGAAPGAMFGRAI